MRWKKFYHTTLMFLFAYTIFLMLITNALSHPAIPLNQYLIVGLIISIIVTLLYILPISFQSFVYSSNGVNHTITSSGGLIVHDDLHGSKAKYSVVKYVYYMTISILGIVAYTQFSGLQILIANSAIGLGSFFALVELMPTHDNGTKQFSKTFKKSYLVMLVMSATLFLISLQHFWL